MKNSQMSEPALAEPPPPCDAAGRIAQLERRLLRERTALADLRARQEAIVAERTEALRRAHDAALAASSAKSAFLANMSHEIRTPLTSIIGFGELLLSPEGGGVDRTDALRAIVRNGRHLLDILNDILDLAKIETGQVEVEHIPIELADLLRDLVTLCAHRAEAKGLAFELEPVLPLPSRFTGDPVRIKQILLNFCSNAIKFTERGEVRVTIGCDEERRTLVLAVRDTGIGMSPAQRERLFQPFMQADASTTRRFGGTGLGLYLSRQIADALGGRVEVDSREGEGSCFRLLLPLEPGTAQGWVDREEALYRGGARPDFQVTDVAVPAIGGRVLLAEDGIDNQRLLGAYLRQAGLEVTIVGDGARAVEAALAVDHDLVLMDMQMPVMDGISAVRMLRAAGFARPIVAITANVMKADLQRCREAGCDEVLAKPVDRQRFYEVVTTLVGRRAPPPGQFANPEFERELAALVAQFRAGLPGQLAAMRDALGARDWGALRNLVHTLKGTAGSYGYPRLTELAAAVEQPLAAGRTARASVLCEELILEARAALRAVTAAPAPAADPWPATVPMALDP